MAITNKDIDNIEKRFVGKFATKDDLKQFATKDDLKQFATKQDLEDLFNRMFQVFATKQDLAQLEHRFGNLENRFGHLEHKFGQLEHRFMQLEFKIDDKLTEFRSDILSHVDGVVGDLKTIREEQVMISNRVYEDHEPRITQLESLQNIVSA